jgi:hypothetical protein
MRTPPVSRTKGVRNLAALAAPELVGHLRLPHSPRRSEAAGLDGVERPVWI